MRSRETWALLVGVALLAAGCTPAPAVTTTSVPVTTTGAPSAAEPVATSTTSAPSTTTTTVAVRLPANDVDDPTEAIVAIFEYVDYLATRPELAREYLGLVYAETCDCYDRLLADFDTYIANGWVQDDEGVEVITARVTQQFANDNVLLEVAYSYSPQFVVDRTGNRQRLEQDEWDDRVSIIGLELGNDSRWRVGVIGIIGESA